MLRSSFCPLSSSPRATGTGHEMPASYSRFIHPHSTPARERAPTPADCACRMAHRGGFSNRLMNSVLATPLSTISSLRRCRHESNPRLCSDSPRSSAKSRSKESNLFVRNHGSYWGEIRRPPRTLGARWSAQECGSIEAGGLFGLTLGPDCNPGRIRRRFRLYEESAKQARIGMKRKGANLTCRMQKSRESRLCISSIAHMCKW